MNTMDRKQFMALVGTSIGAIVLQQCLSGCKNEKDSVTPTTPGSGTKVDFSLNLTTTTQLATNGGYLYSNGIIVARTKSGSYIAVSQTCTHEGTSVQYRLATDDIYCPNHGSTFTTSGTVTNGPAVTALKQYKTELSGNTLRVFE
ncbi:QcrA and Rieske domain-containing protein [Siphonobacter aquaeclarae]|jgi:cytochrome b6-f complex iron-sulfur subunit|uniref:Rieske Fe-S protein n=1 Tax=Siphonobacter aquaeclarae TaxID=563176 RepID=A0A1G9QD46_9BACT|nr:Rieske 2Fe-2S domain-containing protein [Siphonobacter aquaeclarae]MBO9639679.1 Rieske 2Fe-2S domain-containing protein [Siphonobacter aquaeclarae]SDM08919.1 Rieske Fe-S protein [Siphonobacter aquaeclarae]